MDELVDSGAYADALSLLESLDSALIADKVGLSRGWPAMAIR